MSDRSATTPGLSLPRDTFARLAPGPFLHAHLKSGVRPSGRHPSDYRLPAINTGSLSHANGSAVVRLGDTAVVCGVRAETLLASDIPNPPKDNMNGDQLIESLGLVIPNVELSTGCSPAHLPGNPPSSQAQSLTYRMKSMLQGILHPDELRIQYDEPVLDDDLEPERSRTMTKAYWALYVDILCIALDGNALDAICLAAVAALQDTVLPHAWWDPDREAIVCSPFSSENHRIRLERIPVASSFAIFSTSTPLKNKEDWQSWILADPDGLEEGCCNETVTVVLEHPTTASTKVRKRLENYGGSFIAKRAMRQCIQAAEERCHKFRDILEQI